VVTELGKEGKLVVRKSHLLGVGIKNLARQLNKKVGIGTGKKKKKKKKKKKEGEHTTVQFGGHLWP